MRVIQREHSTRLMCKRSRCAGFLLIDAAAGLAMLVLLTATLAVAIGSQHTSLRLIDRRHELTQLAQRALVRLESGLAAKQPGDDPQDAAAEVHIDVLDAHPADASADGDHVWIRLTVSRDGDGASLIGYVRPEVLTGMREGSR